MADEKKSVLQNNLAVLTSPDGIQKYILGTKRNGTPRALYDVVKDIVEIPLNGGKKKKKAKEKGLEGYGFYMELKQGKKKKKKNKKKHWHI